MGSMGVVINVIVSFHSIYILYHISHIYMICVSYTHIYIDIYPVFQRFFSAWWPWGPTPCCLGWHCHADS
jgi:hypothetical protein